MYIKCVVFSGNNAKFQSPVIQSAFEKDLSTHYVPRTNFLFVAYTVFKKRGASGLGDIRCATKRSFQSRPILTIKMATEGKAFFFKAIFLKPKTLCEILLGKLLTMFITFPS